MNTYSPLRWAIPAAVTVCAWSAFGQTVNPANQIAWPQVTGSGTPSLSCTATNYGQPYTDIAANKGYTCTPSGWVQTGGGGSSSFTSNVGVGANGSSAYAPVSEVQYLTASGNTAYACQEDHNRGVWDVRCRGWASNPSTALINTIQAAECFRFVNGGSAIPQVNLPAGSYSLGGNISLPPGLDLEGVQGTEFGSLTNLTTTDSTQPMLTQVSTQNFTCNSTVFTANGAGATVGNIAFHGGGSAHSGDIGLLNSAASSYTHNDTFTNFGGPARTLTGNGINSRGDHILATSNLQWYYFSGSYNPSGFADTNWHAQLDLFDADSRWDHIEVVGQLQDTGYYNRYYLTNVNGGGNSLTDSFIQIAPHNLVMGAGDTIVSDDRFDDGWWDSIHIPGGVSAGITIKNNIIGGYCTSPTLNPANFPSNPGGITTDPNCAAIENFILGTKIGDNLIGQSGALWPFWAVGDIFQGGNIIGGIPSVINQPTSLLIGALGFNAPVNPGADVGQSMYDMTQSVINNAGGTLHFNNFKHVNLADSAATVYTNFDGIYQDIYVSINVGGNDTITNGGAFRTCTGANVTGGGWSWWWNVPGFALVQQACASGGGGGGGLTGQTPGFFPLANTSTTSNSSGPLDYNITNPGMVTSSKPVVIQDGTGLGGTFNATEGTAPSGAANTDLLWADSTAHRLKMNNNSAGASLVVGIASAGTSGDSVHLASNGIDLVDSGAPPSTFTPTRTVDTGAGTGGTATLTSGANDDTGWITIVTGTCTAGVCPASSGVVTITYGGTYSNIRKCSIDPASANAVALGGSVQLYIPISTSTTTNFVVNSNTTGLPQGTTLQYIYRCGT